MCGEGQPRHGDAAVRQERHLDVARDAQLLLHALLLRLFLQQVLDACRHRIEGFGQLPELIVGSHDDLVLEVAPPHPFGAGKQLVDGAGDRARECEAHHERGHLNHQEQDAEDGHAEREKRAKRHRPVGGGHRARRPFA
jgi:hypothetical protein